ncbi:unnamed protein product [Pneumocystis jirovecii]|uniref:Uncharacterized protein n=1 Tax=Pneumocystis jirovecii TaxID=42068 RepID=L0P759_PNEJI|nr:unnamed protein product [Pneumocystis jirovecii]CCJ28251.1 unnamed protein product [Pneumocystis jirovecii]
MSQDLKNNRSSNSSNEQPTPKKFSLENLANLSKILASVVSICFIVLFILVLSCLGHFYLSKINDLRR